MDFPGENLVIKMWESLVDKGIGGALQPWQEKRLGKARNELRRDELLGLAVAERDAANIRSGNRVDCSVVLSPLGSDDNSLALDQRIEPTFGLEPLIDMTHRSSQHDSVRREVNVSRSIVIAENILANDTSEVPDADIDEDWLYSWRSYAGRTSSEELQDLWGRVLAEEIKGPGSYSFRTLEFLKGLSKSEAEVISSVAQFVLAGYIWKKKDELLKKEDVTFSRLMFLQDIGILSAVDGMGVSVTLESSSEKKFMKALISHDMAIGIKHDDKGKKISPEVYVVTNLGIQVLGLASFKANREYLESIAKDYANQGFDVQLGEWHQASSGEGHILNEVRIEADI